MSSLKESASYRHLMGDSEERLFCDVFLDAADFEHNGSRFYTCGPEIGLSLSFSHSGFEGLRTYGFVWEYSDIDLSFSMEEVCGGNTPGFDVPCANPTCLQRLQTILTKSDEVASPGIAFHLAALALSVLNSFWHHSHDVLSLEDSRIVNVLLFLFFLRILLGGCIRLGRR